MGSQLRIPLFHILHFVRDLLFPLLKNSKFGADDRGHRLRITHTWRRICNQIFKKKDTLGVFRNSVMSLLFFKE